MNSDFTEFILKNEELLVLLNVLYSKDNNMFMLYPYTIRRDIIRINLEKTVSIKMLINQDNYQQILVENELYDFPEIIPQFKILRKILIASGFLKMENWTSILNEFKKIKSINPLKGQRHTFIALDTNCYINRIYSVMKHEFRRDISHFYFVLSRIVKTELTSMKKISNTQLNNFKYKYQDIENILNEFWNSDTLNTRKKHIGLVEFNKLRQLSKCLINNRIQIDPNREYDFQIIEDYRNQILTQNYNLLLLSSDKQVAEQAREPGINSVYLKLPPLNKLPYKYSGTWQMFCDFLYLTSVYFGAISLRGNNHIIQILGLWRGKQSSNWDLESIKVRIGSDTITNLLKTQLNIIRK